MQSQLAMRELTLDEIEAVSGAGFWSDLWSGIENFFTASAEFLGFDGRFGAGGGSGGFFGVLGNLFGGNNQGIGSISLEVQPDGTELVVGTVTRPGESGNQDAGAFVSVGTGAFGGVFGGAIGPSADDNFDYYAWVGAGNEGLSVFVGYTNSATGYLEGWSATGSSTFGSGYGIDPATGSPNGAYAVGFGTPGFSATYGINLDELLAPLGPAIASGVYQASTDSSYDPYIGPGRFTPNN